MKKLIPALALLVVSAVLMGTSTFAWFSLNNKVNVTGMTVKTKIGDSLLIAEDTLTSTAIVSEATFTNGLNQTVKGFLEPVSTINGKNFYYTSTANVKADGDAKTDTYVDYGTTGKSDANDSTNYADKFSENYAVDKTTAAAYTGRNAVDAYVDYVFQIKATNTGSDSELRLTKCNLLYNGAAGTANQINAYRVAVFAEDITSGTATGDAGTLVSILSTTDALYFSSHDRYNIKDDTAGTNETSGYYKYTATDDIWGNAATASAVTKWYDNSVPADPATGTEITKYVTVSGNASAKTAGSDKAVDSTSTLGAVSNFKTAAKLADVAATSTKYYKIVVRMWLEGEDETCNNETYLPLTGEWGLDLSIELTTSASVGHTSVEAIKSVANVALTGNGTSTAAITKDANDIIANGEKAISYAWKKASDNTAGPGTNNAYNYTPGVADTYYCLITTDKGNVYRTPNVTLTA